MTYICGNCFTESDTETKYCALCGYDNKTNRETHPLALPAGTVLNGRYIVGKVLGQGGFGITYLAQDYRTRNPVAIKEFFPDTMVTRVGRTGVTPLAGDRSEHFSYGKDSFLNEAKTMAEFIGQPGIVQVYSYFEENNTGYFVMEYVEGQNLQDWVKQSYGRISWNDALNILLPVIEALAVVHEKGIIHRDVTPDNIYIKRDGTVKLLDFGAARHSLGNVSRSLDVVLKHGFAPKEQYQRHGRQGPYTDVYSVAASFYYSITGVRPDDAIERLDDDNLPLPSTLGAKLTIEQEDALLKGLAVKAEDRYQTMLEFRNALVGATKAVPVPIPVVAPAAAPVRAEAPEDGTVGTVSAFGTVGAFGTVPKSKQTFRPAEPVVTPPVPPVADDPDKTIMPGVVPTVDPVSGQGDETEGIHPGVVVPPVVIPVGNDPAATVGPVGFGNGADNDMPVVPPVVPKKKKKVGLIVAICAVALVCAALAFWFLHPHSYGQWEVIKAATCSVRGEQTRQCFCGETQTQSIPKLDHVAVTDNAVGATCSKTGLTEGSHCSVCGAVLQRPEEVPMTEHDIKTLAAVAPTCTKTGLGEGKGCSRCGFVSEAQEEIPALGHTPAKLDAVAATCAAEGHGEGVQCSVCGEVLTQPDIIAKLDHTPVKDAAVAATCKDTGLTEGSHCSVCGEVIVKQETVAKTDHTAVKDPAVAATCSNTGKTEGSHCSVCGTVIKKQETIAKTDHSPTKIPAVAASCTEAGLTEGSKCSVCGKILKEQTRTGSALGHSFSNHECSRCGLAQWYASVSPTKSSFHKAERAEFSITLHSNDPGATIGIKVVVTYELPDGSTESESVTKEGPLSDGFEISYYWEEGVGAPCKVRIAVYTTDGFYLGGTSFSVTG